MIFLQTIREGGNICPSFLVVFHNQSFIFPGPTCPKIILLLLWNWYTFCVPFASYMVCGMDGHWSGNKSRKISILAKCWKQFLFYFLAKNQSEEKWVLSVLHTFTIFCEWRKITLSEKNPDKLCRPQFRHIQQNFAETSLTRNSTYCNIRPPWSKRLGKYWIEARIWSNVVLAKNILFGTMEHLPWKVCFNLVIVKFFLNSCFFVDIFPAKEKKYIYFSPILSYPRNCQNWIKWWTTWNLKQI